MTDVDLFMSNVIPEPNSGCWLWVGTPASRGYGRFNSASTGEVKAHRAAMTLLVGPIPDGMLVCHKCDNPPCVNPQHLFIGTVSDNMRDAVSKGRIPMIANPDPWNKKLTACKRGHVFSEENTRRLGLNNERRECLTCKRELDRQSHVRRKVRLAEAKRLREGGE